MSRAPSDAVLCARRYWEGVPRDGEGAASAGFYETGGRKFLKLQILTAAEVIDGKRPQVPVGHTESLKKASRESEDQQGRLL